MTKTAEKLTNLPCTLLQGVGPKIAASLAKKSIHSIQDLLFHLPFRYEDRTRITPIADIRMGDFVVLEGIICDNRLVQTRRRSLLCSLEDSSGAVIELRFFHFSVAMRQSLQVGTKIRVFGEVRRSGLGYSMIHPEYTKLMGKQRALPLSPSLTPIYPTTEGLGQSLLRKLTDQAIALLKGGRILEECLPKVLREQHTLSDLYDALLYVHRPPPDAQQSLLLEGKHPLLRRIALEELLAHQLSMQKLRTEVEKLTAPQSIVSGEGELASTLRASLSFTLTNAQQRVLSEISDNLHQPHPMLRLVQGDVGCGKTIVAALAMCQMVESGYQAAFMAPTELLAEQHYQNLSKWLEPLGIRTVCLTGSTKTKARREVLQAIQNGEAKVIIGTHALFQKEIEFAKLGLLIIDEQHRFGVAQRMALRSKGIQDDVYPHQLIMTATPIPRTLAMTAYANLDISVIDELPPGRVPVKTVALADERRDDIISRVQHACSEGRQVYWVCTLIEESETLQCQAAEDTAADLQNVLPNLNIALVHGRLKPAEKESIMQAFKAGEIDLLVATTVIEVGVDVPNASLMLIENAERLGLSQLHQLRGRVGRGAHESFCVLLYQGPLSNTAKSRLAIMRETNDGFRIAEEDLKLRGPGDVLGTRQTGLLQLRIADLARDRDLLPQVKALAETINKHYPQAATALVQRWIGDKSSYAKV